MAVIATRSNPFGVDHLALGTSDTERGAAEIERLTGAPVRVANPESGQWYRSAVLPVGEDAFIEVIGPNPAWTRFQPLGTLLCDYDRLRPLFWFVGTENFQEFVATSKDAGHPVERIEHINQADDPGRSRYSRGIVGPGFLSQRPCVIQWSRRPDLRGLEVRCTLSGFALRHPRHGRLNALFARLGIPVEVAPGGPGMSVTLDTPNGPVHFSDPGHSFVGIGAMVRMARLYLRHIRS